MTEGVVSGEIRRPPLARRSRAFESSPWAEAADLLASHPDGIYFGSGAPADEMQPLQRLQDAAARAWAEASDALDYGEVAGYGPLRELIAVRMRHRGVTVDPDDIMITSGSQQGIDLIARLMLDPGDAMVVEGPTYIGAMQTFDAYEASYLVSPLDAGGLDPERLATTVDAAATPPKLLYTIPVFQNPTGYSLDRARREAILEVCRQRQVLVVEDDPYGEIYFREPPEPALRAADPNVVYLGTFSKTIAPGIRVGWMVMPPELRDLLLMAKEGADIHSDRIMTRTVYHTADGFLDRHVEEIRTLYCSRRDALLAALATSMPAGVSWSCPEGGFFVWLTLPDGLSARALLPVAAEVGVAFLPGSWFYPDGHQGTNNLRLSFSSLPEATLAEGARRLGTAVTQFLER